MFQRLVEIPEGVASVSLRFAFPEEIRRLAPGEVRHAGTFDPRTGAPEEGGLFCEQVFGPEGDGLGRIELAVPVLHPWAWWDPQPAARLLGLRRPELERLTGSALREQLAALDLERLETELRAELAKASHARRGLLIRRLEVVRALRSSGVRPEWLMLEALPVSPPAMRSSDGPLAALTQRYQRILLQNARLRERLERGASESDLSEEATALQQAVQALFTALWHTGPAAGARPAPMRQLHALLNGHPPPPEIPPVIREVAWAGSAVVVPDPELPLDRCGLPWDLALRLFRPFVVRRLLETGTPTWAEAEQQVDWALRRDPEIAGEAVWEALEAATRDHPVLVTCDPLRELTGVRAFLPVLHCCETLRVHPLVLGAWLAQGAEEGGFRAAIHVPLSAEARQEARHLLSGPGGGREASRLDAAPIGDLVLGLHLLTEMREVDGGTADVFGSPADALRAYAAGSLRLQEPIRVRMDDDPSGEPAEARVVTTTVGRLALNEILPAHLRCGPEGPALNRKEVLRIVSRSLEECGAGRTMELLEALTRLGLRQAAKSGMSLSIRDFRPPAAREVILAKADSQAARAELNFRRGLLNAEERTERRIGEWSLARNDLFRAWIRESDTSEPIRRLIDSAAIESPGSIHGLFGLPVLAFEGSGRIIDELPIRSSLSEGLTVLEYFVSTLAMRENRWEKDLQLQASHLLCRALVQAHGNVKVPSQDCGDSIGAKLALKARSDVFWTLPGLYVCRDMVHPATGEVLVPAGERIPSSAAEVIAHSGIRETWVRSPLSCVLAEGICARCLGQPMGHDAPPEVGSSVGLHAAFAVTGNLFLPGLVFHTGHLPPRRIDPLARRIRDTSWRWSRPARSRPGREIDPEPLSFTYEVEKWLHRRTLRDQLRKLQDNDLSWPRVAEVLEAHSPRMPVLAAEAKGIVVEVHRGDRASAIVVHSELELDPPRRVVGQVVAEPVTLRGTDLLPVRAGERITVELAARLRSMGVPSITVVRTYTTTYREILVEPGDPVGTGTPLAGLTEDRSSVDFLSPHNRLALEGTARMEAALAAALWRVYSNDGIMVHYGYCALLARRMLSFRRVRSAGDTRFLPGQRVEPPDLERENQRVLALGLDAAVSEPDLLGLTELMRWKGDWLLALGLRNGRKTVTQAALAGRKASRTPS